MDIQKIDINKEQPRKHFDEEKMQDLADSIRQHGVIQPLVVKPEANGRYTVIAGERRYRAARMVGLKQVPVVTKEVTDRELLQISMIENIQREDLNPLEEAQGIAALMEQFSLTQEEAAEILGRSRSAVANSLRLLNLPESVKKRIVAAELSAGHARALLAIKDRTLLEKAAAYVVEKQFSVRETESYVKRLLTERPRPQKKPQTPEFEAAEREIGEILETKVHFNGSDRRGRIVIEYFSKEQLYTLYEYLRHSSNK
ncbi:MAG: ParB/RepB/Spo0J family partition protein [Christensenellaceae bacterium]